MSALTETQERFLRDASTRLPMDRVREVYVFAPMRQGGMETGVAVIAIALEPEAAVEAAPDVSDAVAAEDERAAVDEQVGDVLEEDVVEVVDVSTADAAPAAAPDAAVDPMSGAPAEALVDAGDEAPTEEAERASADVEPSMAAAEPAAEPGAEAADGTAAAEPAAPEPAPDASVRYTVLAARYRLQLKGPDRGKWEVDMVEEADAPLLTVDAVVRGVQRRAGDENEAERLTAADFLAVVSGQATWPATR